MLSRGSGIGLTLMNINRFSMEGHNEEDSTAKTAGCSQTQFLFYLGSQLDSLSQTL